MPSRFWSHEGVGQASRLPNPFAERYFRIKIIIDTPHGKC